jgi:hypothetical protein
MEFWLTPTRARSNSVILSFGNTLVYEGSLQADYDCSSNADPILVMKEVNTTDNGYNNATANRQEEQGEREAFYDCVQPEMEFFS